MLSSISIRAKLISGFIFIGLLVGSVGFIGIKNAIRIDELFTENVNTNIPRLQALSEISTIVNEIKTLTVEINSNEDEVDSDAAISRKYELLAAIDRANQLENIYINNSSMEGISRKEIIQKVNQTQDKILVLANDLTSAKEEKKSPEEILGIQDELNNQHQLFKQLISQSINSELQLLQERNSLADQAAKQTVQINIAIAIAAILLSVLIGVYLSEFIFQRINVLRNAAREFASGKLDKKILIHHKDELGDLAQTFNEMADKINETNLLRTKNQEELQSKVLELQNTKMAMLNTLEDIEEEKTKVDKKRVEDEAILHSIGEGMIVTDNTGSITMINESASSIIGVKPENVVNKNIVDIITLYDVDDTLVPKEKRPLIRALKENKKCSEIFTFKKSDGAKMALGITCAPIIHMEKTIGAIEILRDITKEREVDRMKTEFISLASHQLRTPLSAIKWFVEMLLAGDAGQLSQEQTDFTKNISESTERMIQLVNSLLNISRIESGRIMIDPQPTDLKELVQGVVNDLKAKLEERKQNLIVSVHADLPKISIDPRLIRQVYMNLLTNAIKYTPKEGEITVFISKKDDEIISQVSDNGYGIPKLQQERIFQKFFRAENIVKVETDGTGLGLYLIKAIIESSTGKIWFESEENKGTSFWFSLPAAGTPAKKGEVTLD
ncbi:MAG: ATP-binding protein [bacterium]|nr:ATP-binding protein [bacterium]